jgi:FdhD protein
VISPKKSSTHVQIEQFSDGRAAGRRDVVTVEEPMEIRLEIEEKGRWVEHRVAVTMRTPGDDFELAAGFLFTEGLLTDRSDVVDLRYCRGAEPQEYNIVTVRLRDPGAFDESLLTRNFYTTSSCGVCGKASLEAVEVRGCDALADGGPTIPAEVVRAMPEALRASQPVFDRTGGIHAAGLFDERGELRLLREDVGRHNAVDKVIGHEFLEGRLPSSTHFLVVSGRSSFEIIQKALAAGIPIVVAVGAPSSLAVELARRFNMTLVGFAKPDGFNVYTGGERITSAGC